ncbi:MAG: TIGR04255 family protein [Actinobacteria bacterium]|nr:TIGR04255 family protein [Actinomycetota bacterium]MCG2789860.1 TIGR04255 family protein [Actinomycetes bacterium]
MKRIILNNKPLLEAIFEIRWELEQSNLGPIDPHYKILIGSLYEKIKEEYPFHEQLETANFPDGMISYVTQHRYRTGEKGWPLVQIGPGILTLNDTVNYKWEKFERRIINVVNALFEIYPDMENKLRINKLLLRYINSINFDFSKDNIFEFLKNKMKSNINLSADLFEKTGVNYLPNGFNLIFNFESTKPKGIISLRFSKGKKLNIDSLIWELVMQTRSFEEKVSIKFLKDWIKKSHDLTDDWFFKLIEGDLLEGFK